MTVVTEVAEEVVEVEAALEVVAEVIRKTIQMEEAEADIISQEEAIKAVMKCINRPMVDMKMHLIEVEEVITTKEEIEETIIKVMEVKADMITAVSLMKVGTIEAEEEVIREEVPDNEMTPSHFKWKISEL
jgi:coproporphyrinogen III oxidase-like Fe-S oxidoreductase